jgi:hypothetical protein
LSVDPWRIRVSRKTIDLEQREPAARRRVSVQVHDVRADGELKPERRSRR